MRSFKIENIASVVKSFSDTKCQRYHFRAFIFIISIYVTEITQKRSQMFYPFSGLALDNETIGNIVQCEFFLMISGLIRDTIIHATHTVLTVEQQRENGKQCHCSNTMQCQTRRQQPTNVELTARITRNSRPVPRVGVRDRDGQPAVTETQSATQHDNYQTDVPCIIHPQSIRGISRLASHASATVRLSLQCVVLRRPNIMNSLQLDLQAIWVSSTMGICPPL